MKPRIYVTPAAYSDPQGRAIVGVRAYATEDSAASEWTMHLRLFVAEDLNNDTQADDLDLADPSHAGYGAVVAQTRCY